MNEIYQEAKERMPSQKEKVFNLLKEAGDKGVTNIRLNEIGLRFGQSIYLIKLDGYDIGIENLGDGIVNYTLKNTTPKQRKKYEKGIDVLMREIKENHEGNITTDELKALLDRHGFNIVRKPNALNKIS